MLTVGAAGFAMGLITLIQYGAYLLGGAVNLIMKGIAGLAGGGEPTIQAIVFNELSITRLDFFQWNSSTQINSIATQIGTYYYIMRNLAIAILLGVLLYIGIRMAISTVAADEAKYKKMLIDWAVSLVLVFMLHLIIIATIYANNQIVEAIKPPSSQLVENSGWTTLLDDAAVPLRGIPAVILYDASIFINFAFLFMYIKRFITIGFLIVISPLITITYAIDKISDGKSQALDTWLKEFIFTVIIQPFHCVIYLVFVNTAFQLADEGGLGEQALAIICMVFLLQAERIVKKIFGIRNESMGDALGAAALSIGLLSSVSKIGKGRKEGQSGKKAPTMGDNKIKTKNENGANPSNPSDTNQGNPTGDSDDSGNNGRSQDQGNDGGSQDQGVGGGLGGGNGQYYYPGRPQQNPVVQEAVDKSKKRKIKNGFQKIGKGFTDAAKRYTGEKKAGDIAKSMIRKTARGSMVAFSAIGGATVGGFEKSVTAGVAAYSATASMETNALARYNLKQYEENQKVFADGYDEYVNYYRNMHGNASDAEIMDSLKDLYETSSSVGLSDEELKMYNIMDKMDDTNKALGYTDGWDGIKDNIEVAQDAYRELEEQLEPPKPKKKKKRKNQ